MTIANGSYSLMSRRASSWTIRRRVTAAAAQSWQQGVETITYTHVRAVVRGFLYEEVIGDISEKDRMMTIVTDPFGPEVDIKQGDEVAPGIHTADGTAQWHKVVSAYPPLTTDRSNSKRCRITL